MKLLLRAGLFAIVFALVTGAARSATAPAQSEHGLVAGTVIVPEGLKKEDVQQAILLAATGRGWAVRERTDDRVVLFLEQGNWRSTLTLTYDAKEVQIYSNSGKPDKTGGIKKQAIPEGWVKFLKTDISKNLGQKAYAK